jgi:hypothetical protein
MNPLIKLIFVVGKQKCLINFNSSQSFDIYVITYRINKQIIRGRKGQIINPV